MTDSREELWIKNITKRDLRVTDLGFRVLSGQSVNVFKVASKKPVVNIRYSKKFGSIKELVDKGFLMLLPRAPSKPKQKKIVTAAVMGPSRQKSMVVEGPDEKNIIDQINEDFHRDTGNMSQEEIARINEKFIEEVDLDGFADDEFADD